MSVTLNMQRAHDCFRSRSFSDRNGIGRKRFRHHIFAPWHNPGVVHFLINLNFAPGRSNPAIESFCARGGGLGNWGIHFLCIHFNIHLDNH